MHQLPAHLTGRNFTADEEVKLSPEDQRILDEYRQWWRDHDAKEQRMRDLIRLVHGAADDALAALEIDAKDVAIRRLKRITRLIDAEAPDCALPRHLRQKHD
ncbi:hypothetical protein [Methylobacterium indicum]|uniref:DUF3263 domain-containing protein n=1 Tax=Methylobacterium indicum TaxID=1775910 RepID=A0A8H8X0C9_9HYPH|nr:hypothetical protein [Methylobacterium indicum]BCM87765.1 hypothetical protein mvi_62260 [Methylobacterium indicum]